VKRRAGRPPKSQSEEKRDSDSGFAKNLGVLAEALGIDRSTLQDARKLHASDEPKPRFDGRRPIAAYAKWLDRHSITGRGRDSTVEQPAERGIKLALLQLQLDRQRFEFEKEKDRMLPVAQFEAALAKTISAFLAQLNAFGPRVNEALEGLDFNDRALIIENEVELLRKTLAACDYLSADEGEEEEEEE
jgi:hypothetical protein